MQQLEEEHRKINEKQRQLEPRYYQSRKFFSLINLKYEVPKRTKSFRRAVVDLERRTVNPYAGRVIPTYLNVILRPISIKERHTTPCRPFVNNSKVQCSFIVIKPVIVNSKDFLPSSILGHSNRHGFGSSRRDTDLVKPN
ncbi:hypothetical protein FRC03_011884, partial [Tulasnella sp. 419]